MYDHCPVTEHKNPVDQLIDLLVFAPLGFAADARTLMPKLIDRGHDQVTMAKMVGQFVVQQGQSEAAKQLTNLQAQAVELLAEFGLVTPEPATNATRTPAPTVPAVPDPMPTAAPPAAEPTTTLADDLAVTEYDSLAASQVIPRLAGLAEDELEAVRSYEASHRGRKTILSKIAQLQA